MKRVADERTDCANTKPPHERQTHTEREEEEEHEKQQKTKLQHQPTMGKEEANAAYYSKGNEELATETALTIRKLEKVRIVDEYK